MSKECIHFFGPLCINCTCHVDKYTVKVLIRLSAHVLFLHSVHWISCFLMQTSTCYGLEDPRIDPGGGHIFRTRPDGLWGPPSLLYNGYRIFPGGKAAGAWRWPPPRSSAEVKERVELYLFSPSGPSWPVLGWTYLYLFTYADRILLRLPPPYKRWNGPVLYLALRACGTSLYKIFLANHEDGNTNLVRNIYNNLQISMTS
jgi:hypothetical protein